ncbi:MAG: GNAT family N-acetyltransferase [Chloroflexi bacterium]|nr:GNAT family N-acetyltransferase [Chloroflexota bacterium]
MNDASSRPGLSLEVHPLTPDRWPDLEALLGPGGVGGCWCMWWRLTQTQWNTQRGERNRQACKEIVERGETPGLLAYADGQPVGWCAIGPRTAYPRLERSRTLRRVDDEQVWSVTCFFVARGWRRKGVSEALLRAAVELARQRGAQAVEGYPLDPAQGQRVYTWTGLASSFRKAGFTEVVRRSRMRPIMRLVVRSG